MPYRSCLPGIAPQGNQEPHVPNNAGRGLPRPAGSDPPPPDLAQPDLAQPDLAHPDQARSGLAWDGAASIVRGAAIVAGFTMASRLLGLIRTLVFSQTIGASCLGSAYVTANQVPNLIYELVLGGALTSAMVPVLARPAERAARDPAERAGVSQISSALLTWSVIILVPLTAGIAAAARPIAALLNPVNANAHCVHADVVNATGNMLVVFAPQALLYGLSVVLYGLLQAYRRFTAPSVGPAISSLVVIAAYLAFVPLAKGLPLARLPLRAELVLSVGTTLGVAALVVVAVVPTWRLRLRIRPTLRLPPGIARRAGGLAIVGVIDLIVSDLSSVVAITLANGHGQTGAIVLYNYAWQAYTSVFGVLAMSIIISTFPVLAARAGPVFDRTCAGSTRAVLLMSWLGTAVIAAVAVPAAHVLARQPDQVSQLIAAFALFAPGVAGIALISNLTRAMFAIGRLKVAAAALAGSWLLVIAADLVLVELAPARLTVAALALGTTIGQTVVAVPLVFATRRICGPAAMAGTGRASLAALAAGAAAAAVGVAVSLAVPLTGRLLAVALAALAAMAAVLVFAAVAYLLDPTDTRPALLRAARLTRLPRRRT
jgi:putative peptidoglycan lipid II flippase